MNIDFSKAVTAEERAVETIACARADAAKSLAGMLDAATADLCKGIPVAEQMIWSAKEASARSVLAGTATADQSALIGDEAAQTGEPIEQLARTIVTRAEAFRTEVTRIVVLRRQASAALAACTSTHALEAVLTDVAMKLATG